VCLTLSGCTAAYRFQYEYALVTPSAPGDGFEDTRVRIRLAPTSEVGVFQLAVHNKNVQPIAVVWTRTQYIDPLGRSRPALEAGPQGLIRSPGWFVADSPIDPGSELRMTIRPGGPTSQRLVYPSHSIGSVDPRVPAEEEFDTTARLQGHPAYNPFTVSRYAGGDIVVSSSPLPFLPTSGDTPTLGEAYKGREFRFVLALRQDRNVVLYPFTFRITAVAINASNAP
jgi:hypothetical protein